MKIEKINIKNFKGIKNLEKEINGGNVYLIGGNGTGKTSFIDAVWVGLTGKGVPPEPTTDGAKKGLIEIDLGEFIARTKFTKGKPTLFELENKEFDKESEKFIKAPRTYLANKIGMLDFDVHDFFNKNDSEKLKYFAKILDTDFSQLDDEISEVMESRKFDKKKLAEWEAGIDYYDEAYAAKEVIDVVVLAKKIQEETDKLNTYDRVNKGLEERRAKIIELQKEIDKAREWLSTPDNMPLPMESREELQKKLDSANEENKKIQEAKVAAEADKKVEELKKQITEADQEIEELRQKKATKISDSIRIKDLEYNINSEQFLYKGLPFDDKQQNTADQLIAGMHIASSLLKELRIIKVDGSLIDRNNFEKVLSWATERDIELFIEIVDRDASTLQINVE